MIGTANSSKERLYHLPAGKSILVELAGNFDDPHPPKAATPPEQSDL